MTLGHFVMLLEIQDNYGAHEHTYMSRLTIVLEKYHTFSCSIECKSLDKNINPQSHTAQGTHGP